MRGEDRVVGECLFYYRIVHIIVSNVYDIFVHECDIRVRSDGGSALGLTGHRRYVDVATTCCEILKIVSSLTFLAKRPHLQIHLHSHFSFQNVSIQA